MITKENSKTNIPDLSDAPINLDGLLRLKKVLQDNINHFYTKGNSTTPEEIKNNNDNRDMLVYVNLEIDKCIIVNKIYDLNEKLKDLNRSLTLWESINST